MTWHLRQVRHGPTKTIVLFLEPLQFLELFRAHSAVLFLPAVIGLFRHADLTDRIYPGHPLPHQNFNLPQLHDNLFRLRSLNRHLWSSVFLNIGGTNSKGEAQPRTCATRYLSGSTG
jgi:hypothetical protein